MAFAQTHLPSARLRQTIINPPGTINEQSVMVHASATPTTGRVLLIGSDPRQARSLAVYLRRQGLKIESIQAIEAIHQRLDAEAYDCLIVDLDLTDDKGLALVRRLRPRVGNPIVVLASNTDFEKAWRCLELGADDFSIKPVNQPELLMRLKHALNRDRILQHPESQTMQVGPISMDRSRHEARYRDGSVIDFTLAEFNLLWVLAQADGRVISRNDMLDAITNGDGPESVRAVDVLVSRVRKKLGKEAILTVSKVGYKCGLRLQREER